MKMRASLQFALALGSVVLLAGLGLVFANRGIRAHARLDVRSGSSADISTQVRAQYGQLPLAFEANLGQTAPEVQFLSHGSGYELFLTHEDAVLALWRPAPVWSSKAKRTTYLQERRDARQASKTSVLRLHFVGANSAAAMKGLNRLPGRTDYFNGNDPRNWHTGVPSYAQVEYRGIYPGVDTVFYGNQKQLEYDLRLAPGAKLDQLAFDVQGASRLSLDPRGNLVMHVADSDVVLTKPAAYQDFNGQRREVAANYAIGSNNRVSFSVAAYDDTKSLVIDPVLDYSTYLGGSAGNSSLGLFDTGYGIAVDSSGNAYVTGQTLSSKFPTTSSITPPDPNIGINAGVFVTEINPAGTAKLYSTYLSGNGGETGFGVAVDPSGKIYVAGETFSSNFPGTGTGTNGFEPNPASSTNLSTLGTGFISKIDPTKSGAAALVYSSYLGGSDGDFAASIAADSNSNAYAVGFTISQDFPMTTPASGYQSAPTGTAGNAFLVRVDTTQTGAASLIYSTYLGGDGAKANVNHGIGYGDSANGVAVDSTGTAYMVGETTSSNFPTLNGLQSGPNANNQFGEAFVSVIDTGQTGQSSLLYSTYLGGEVYDLATGVSLEPGNARPADAVYVTGTTTSTQFPIFPKPSANSPGAYASTITQSGVAFVTELDTTQAANNSLTYSAVVGGSSGDEGNGIQADSSGNAYVAGTTTSSDFPITPGAFQTADTDSQGIAFVFEINPGGNGNADLFYSTFFGGSGANGGDQGTAIALGPSNNVYITGTTGSTDLPIFPTSAFQTTMTKFDSAATSSAFVAELTLEPTVAFSGTTLAFGNEPINNTYTNCPGLTPCAVTITNNTSAGVPLTIGPITPTPPLVTTDFAFTSTCGSPAVIAAGGNCTIAVTFSPTAAEVESATLPVVYTAANNTAATQNIALSGTGTVFSLSTSAITFPGQLITSTSTPAQTVTLTNTSTASINFTTAASAGFAESDSCGGSVAAGAMCTLNVTFTPSTAGPAAGTLTVTSGGQAQTVQLSGIGGDFSVTMPASIAVTNNSGSGTANLTWTSGFANPPSVSFTCTTTVPNGSCSAPTQNAAGSFSVSVSVSAAVPPANRRFDVWRTPTVPVIIAILALLALPLLRRRRAWLAFATLLIAVGMFSACSGSNKSGGQSYSLSLTASAASNGTTVSQNYTTSVTVQ